MSAAGRFIRDKQHKIDKTALTKAKGKKIPNKSDVRRGSLDVVTDGESALCFTVCWKITNQAVPPGNHLQTTAVFKVAGSRHIRSPSVDGDVMWRCQHQMYLLHPAPFPKFLQSAVASVAGSFGRLIKVTQQSTLQRPMCGDKK